MAPSVHIPDVVKPPQSTILLVDDDPAIRQILCQLLEEENYITFTAANGMEALEVASRTKPDLVLLDLNMPVMDGRETFAQLTRINPLLPIILISGQPNQTFPTTARGAGVMLEKPLDFVKLFETIRTLLIERPDMQMARLTGQPTIFSKIPPLQNPTDRHTNPG